MTFLKVAVFSLAVLLVYTLFANILPQVQSNPPEEEVIDTAALDQAGQIAWGERLFAGKGTCSLCHNDLGRAPNLLALDLAATFPERIAGDRYDGAAKGEEGAAAIAAYVRESMLEPSAYVVAGFGKKGSNDSESPMPKADAPPASLAAVEIDALIAFLQDRAGAEVTVALPGEDAEVAALEEDAADEEEEGPLASADEVIEWYGCAACHDLQESGADLGPPLAGVALRMDREQLRRAILDPDAEIAEGFEPEMMPTDFGEQMRASELEMLVDHLMALPAAENGAGGAGADGSGPGDSQ
jgi:hypothetical protein